MVLSVRGASCPVALPRPLGGLGAQLTRSPGSSRLESGANSRRSGRHDDQCPGSQKTATLAWGGGGTATRAQ